MSVPGPSLTRGLFAGVIHAGLRFPYPPPLAERSPGEARAVARVLADLRRLEGDVIDAARFDEEETVPAPVIQALAGIGMLGLTIPEEYGGLGLSATGSARVGEAILDEAAPGRPAPGAP